MADYVKVASLADLPPGTLLGVEIGGHSVCLVNTEGEVYALRNNCSHRDFALDSGSLEDGHVVCSWHGARFDPATGRATRLPAIKPVVTYEVRVEGEDILVAI
jgi:3-phenylpropionate/trans-cinnamate dioxygenase ferredoxin component